MTFPPMQDLSNMSKAGTQADNVLRADILEAMLTATETGTYTSGAITWTTVSEQDILVIIKELRGQGYNVAEGSSTITVTWQ